MAPSTAGALAALACSCHKSSLLCPAPATACQSWPSIDPKSYLKTRLLPGLSRALLGRGLYWKGGQQKQQPCHSSKPHGQWVSLDCSGEMALHCSHCWVHGAASGPRLQVRGRDPQAGSRGQCQGGQAARLGELLAPGPPELFLPYGLLHHLLNYIFHSFWL